MIGEEGERKKKLSFLNIKFAVGSLYYLHFYTNGISKSHTQKSGKARADVVPVAQSLHQRELVPVTVGVEQLPGPAGQGSCCEGQALPSGRLLRHQLHKMASRFQAFNLCGTNLLRLQSAF